MRQPRLKPDYQDTWHHCYNRIAGCPGDFPFGTNEKEQFVRILLRISRLYTVRVLAYQVMSNHFHLILHTPADAPTPEEICRRYAEFHNHRRSLDPNSKLCALWGQRMRDISWFMAHLERLFTVWFNRTRPARRRGALWADRFKNTVLENGLAVWDCWKYVELNPVRAGLAPTPADYRHGSFGVWSQGGRHPFEHTLKDLLLPWLREVFRTESVDAVLRLLRQEFVRISAEAAHECPADVQSAIEIAGQPIRFSTQAHRRMRYWVDGLVIGSELFVRNVMRRMRGSEHVQKRRLTRATEATADALLCSYRQLRVVQT
jgi:REP element-mobilizing transposase RayT